MHLAAQALRRGECELALAGGVTVMMTPTMFVEFSRLRAMAPDGRCKSFSDKADGAGWSEGCGLLVLERLQDAERHGHPILAILRGSAINQDGRSQGLTAPNGPAQQQVIQSALQDAGLIPQDINAVEAHGTGTTLGDPIEAQALLAVYGQHHSSERPLWLGSLKSNLGHTQAAAGALGVIKMVLALQAQLLPKTLHAEAPSHHIDWSSGHVALLQQPQAWPRGAHVRRAAVSAFGVSGTNAHVILEEAPLKDSGAMPASPKPLGESVPLLLSGQSEGAVRAYAAALAEALAAPTAPPLGDVAFTLALHRSHLPHRAAVLAKDAPQAIVSLNALAQGRSDTSCITTTAQSHSGVVFIFPGQGSQWPGMARSLLNTLPSFAQAITELAQALQPYTDYSLLQVLQASDEQQSRLFERVDIVQPVLFALAVALAKSFEALGVVPTAVVGHSQGEIAAACVSGALSVEQGAHIVAVRSRLLRKAAGTGRMATVGLAAEEIQKRLLRYAGRLSVAVVNSPSSTGIAGEVEAVAEFGSELRREGVFFREIAVDYASHCAQVEGVLMELQQGLQGLLPKRGRVPMISTVTGREMWGEELGAEYWVKNLRQPVRMDQALSELKERGNQVYLEVSGHPQLLAAVEEVTEGRSGAVGTLRRGEGGIERVVRAAAELYAHGAAVNFEAVLGRGQLVELPTYAFQRQRHWVEGNTVKRDTATAGLGLLGSHLTSARSREQIWEVTLDPKIMPLLCDHRVHGLPLVPMSVLVDLVLSAAATTWTRGTAVLKRCVIHAPLILPEEGRRPCQLIFTPQSDDRLGFELFTANDVDDTWQQHISGEVVRVSAVDVAPDERRSLTEIRARCRNGTTGQDHEVKLRERGLSLEGSFRCVERVWHRAGEALARIRLPESKPLQTFEFRVHPAVLEAGMRALVSAMPETNLSALLLPDGFEHLSLYGRVGTAVWSHALLRDTGSDGAWAGDVRLLNEDGRVMMEITGLRFRMVDTETTRQAAERHLKDWLYELVWQPKPLKLGKARQEKVRRWLILADRSGVGVALGDALRDRGHQVLLAFAGTTCGSVGTGKLMFDPSKREDFEWLLVETEERLGSLQGVVHLMALDATSGSKIDLAALKATQDIGCNSIPPMVQTFVAASPPISPTLWFITRGAQPAGENPTPLAIAQAPLWGMGRSLALEHPDLWGGMVDLDPTSTEAGVAQILDEILDSDGEDNIAFRGDERRVARVQRVHVDSIPNEPAALRADASYLIIGGLGRLGLQVARRLVSAGARHLVLTGRRGLPHRATWDTLPAEDPFRAAVDAVVEIERLGAAVTIAAVDVTDEVQMAALFTQIRPELRGVVHIAGALKQKPILETTREDALTTLAAKVEGSFILHRLTCDLRLDFFVLSSAVSSMWGSALQGIQGAANHFMDGLAHHRRSLGLPATSINWGAWEGGGMLIEAGKEALNYLEQIGFGIIPAPQASEIFSRFLGSETPVERAVAAIDWSRYKPVFESRRKMPLFELIHDGETAREGEAIGASSELLERFAASSAADRIEVIRAHVRCRVMEVLGLRADDQGPPLDQGFFQLGMDSLMSVRLRRCLEVDLGCSLPTTLAFEHPSIERLSIYLTGILSRDLSDAPRSKEQIPESRQESVRAPVHTTPSMSRQPSATQPQSEALANASEDELLAMLAGELAELHVRSARK
jgi:myxalamid-type polyketide synthase MxaE and MxaD